MLTGLKQHGPAAGVISGGLTAGSLPKAHAITIRARRVRAAVPEPTGGGAA
ncbi:hypothetical protein ACIBF1_11290 [Spirillospora sp. NPDC050679]